MPDRRLLLRVVNRCCPIDFIVLYNITKLSHDFIFYDLKYSNKVYFAVFVNSVSYVSLTVEWSTLAMQLDFHPAESISVLISKYDNSSQEQLSLCLYTTHKPLSRNI